MLKSLLLRPRQACFERLLAWSASQSWSQSVCCSARASGPSLDDVKNSQKELDDFFGAEHAPAEQDVLNSTSIRSAEAATPPQPSAQAQRAGDALPASRPPALAALSHVGADGRARMVDVGHVRIHVASCSAQHAGQQCKRACSLRHGMAHEHGLCGTMTVYCPHAATPKKVKKHAAGWLWFCYIFGTAPRSAPAVAVLHSASAGAPVWHGCQASALWSPQGTGGSAHMPCADKQGRLAGACT